MDGRKTRRMNRILSGVLAGLMLVGTFFGTDYVSMKAKAAASPKVHIVLEDALHGSLQFVDSEESELEVPLGTAVTVQLTPEDGYAVDTVAFTDAAGDTSLLEVSDSVAAFVPENSGTISAIFTEPDGSGSENEEVFVPLTTEGSVETDLESYILAYADRSKVGEGDTLTRQDLMHVTATVIDKTMVKEASLDGLWCDEDGDGLSEYWQAMRNQGQAYITLYSVSEDSDYLVGQACSESILSLICDYGTAKNNMNAEMLEDIVFDEETGLVYVPKKYHYDENGDESGLQTRIQILFASDAIAEERVSLPMFIQAKGVKGTLPETGMTEASLLSILTHIQLTEDERALLDVKEDTIDSITINGIVYKAEDGMWHYEKETGELTVSIAPVNITEIVIDLSESFGKDFDRFLGKAGNFFKSLFSVDADAADFTSSIKFSRVPQVGDSATVEIASGIVDRQGHVLDASQGWVTAHRNAKSGSVDGDTITLRNIVNRADINVSSLVTGNYNVNRPTIVLPQTVNGITFPELRMGLQCSHVADAAVAMTIDGIDYSVAIKGSSGDNWSNGQLHHGNDSCSHGPIYGNIYVSAVDTVNKVINFGVIVPNVRTQAGVGYFEIPYELSGGEFSVKKFSANPSCTDGNEAYSLIGAQYGVYKDRGCTQLVKTLTVQNETGLTESTGTIDEGDYWVKEIKAPKGYILNTNAKAVHVTSGDKGRVINMDGMYADEPKNDPVSVMLQKAISGTNTAGTLRGDITTLAGIKFRIDWYKGYYNTAEEAAASGKLGASAIFETKDVILNGQLSFGHLLFANAEPVDGTSWPFKQSVTDVWVNYMPLGTCVITEVSTLEGLIVKGMGSVLHVIDTDTDYGSIQNVVGWDNITPGEGVFLDDPRVVSNSNITVSKLIVEKLDKDGQSPRPQGDGSLIGVEYSVINKSQNPVTYNGKEIPVGGVVTTMRTERVGDKNIATAEHLPYGTYEVVETKAGEGYLVDPDWTSGDLPLHTTGEVTVNANYNEPQRGNTQTIVKLDADTGESAPQGDGHLDGAEFAIYNKSNERVFVGGVWYEPNAQIGANAVTAYENGQYVAKMTGLPYGTYELREVKAPVGYDLDPQTYSFTVRENGQVDVVSRPMDSIWRSGEVKVVKADADWHTSNPQGDATLAGTKYEIVNRSEHFVQVGGTNYEVGEVVTTLTTAWNEADQAYTASTSGLPYGTYEIREVQAPTGYNNANWSETFTIREKNQEVKYDRPANESAVNRKWNEDAVMRGGITVGKVDRETKQYLELGEAELSGASFEIINRSEQPVFVHGTTYAVGDVVMTIATKEMTVDGKTVYAATTENHVLPYGTYEIKEVASGTGYLFDSQSKAWQTTVEIRGEGDMQNVIAETDVVANQVIREDWHFQKKAEDTMERMDQIAFLVESLTTGERHILVTDENGTWGSAWVPHTTRTNENDPTSPISNGAVAVDEDGEWVVVDSSKLNCDAGIWFAGRPEDEVTWGADGKTYTIGTETISVQDTKRAFPYDTYRVQELRCDNNVGYGLAAFTVTLHRYGADPDGDGIDIDYGTVDDRVISIGTTLAKSTETAFDSDVITLIDTVTYDGLMVGTNYTIKGEIHGVNKDGSDAGVIATVEVPFTPTTASGRTDVEFQIKTKDITTPSVVAFEYLKIGRAVVAEHADIADENQTVKVPQIGTTLTGDLDHMANGKAEEIVLTDTIAYSGFDIGKEYVATGTLMDAETGEAVLDGDGNPITATAPFTAVEENGTTTVTFRFRGVDLSGKTVVAFEEVTKDGKKYAVHADLSDEAQTVTFPAVSSFAANAQTSNKSLAEAENQTVKEVVRLTNLMDGYSYKLVGELHVRENGNDLGALADAPVLENEFTASEPIQTMLFEGIDGRELGGKDLVVFQTLYGRATEEDPWIRIGDGADITDDEESVKVPHIGTTLLTEQKIHETQLGADSTVSLTDTVAYENLIPGHTYSLVGVLHVQDTDEDGNLVDGGEVEDAKTLVTFVPETAAGTVDLTFTFDASKLSGKGVTAFETLYASPKSEVSDEWKEFFDLTEEDPDMEKPKDEWKAAEHADITDEGQTVHFVELGTTLLGPNGLHETDVPATKEIRLTDTIAYRSLVPGTEYTVTGVLHVKTTDEDGNVVDGGALTDVNGKEITASTTFVPTTTNGTVDVVFVFEASDLVGKTVVAFESISTEGVEFGAHADIEDEDQTVHFVKLGTTALTEDGLHETQVTKDTVTITDTVAYENVIPGVTYTMTGTLHKQIVNADGSIVDGGALLDAEGNVLTSEVTFTAKEANGTVEMTFTVPTAELSGETLVAFEELKRDGVTVGTHTDITDEEQSIHFVELHTTATGENGAHEVELPKGEDKTVTIVDRVEYTNLIPGKEYTLTGVLHKQAMNKKGELVDDGELSNTKQELTFIPETRNGFVDMTFILDVSDLAGTTLIAFEEVSRDGKTVATHTDITDEAQSVTVVELHTTALGENGSHMTQVPKDGMVTITDTVAYRGLVPGKTYTVTGTLHVKDQMDTGEIVDGGAVKGVNKAETDDAEADANAELTATTTFVPLLSEGTVDVVFTFDASELAGKTVVAFESLSRDEITVATHADITDEDQSINFVRLRTKATADNGEHTMEIPEGSDQMITVTDLVEYKNLIPGLEYTIKGEIHVQSVDANGNITDMGILAHKDGEAVHAETTFVPETADGSVELKFRFAATGLGNRTIVVFETLLQDEIVVATHADITDEHQSVTFKSTKQEVPPIAKPEPPREIVETGETPLYLLFVVLGVVLMAGAGYLLIRRRKKA